MKRPSVLSLPLLLTVAACAAGTSAAPSPGGPAEPLRLGETVDVLAAASHPSVDLGGYQVFTLTGAPGDRLMLQMTSREFTPVLRVGQQLGGVTHWIATDLGWSGDIELRITLPEAGEYVVLAGAADPGQGGSYSLVAERLEPVFDDPMAIAFGEVRQSRLSHRSNEYADLYGSGRGYVESWTFDGEAGRCASIHMRSSDVDSYLYLGIDRNGVFQQVAFNDDGGQGLDAWIQAELPESGRYIVLATTFGSDAIGAYTLELEEECGTTIVEDDFGFESRSFRQPDVAMDSRSIQVNQIRESSFEEGHASLQDTFGARGYFEDWRFTGEAGMCVIAEMRSGDVDSYIFVGIDRDGSFEQLGFDDDGGEWLNSQLEIFLHEDGEYVLRATTFGADELGHYEVEVSGCG